MSKTRNATILAAAIAVASLVVMPAAGASAQQLRGQDDQATTTAVDRDQDRLRQCDRDRRPERPADCRRDDRLQCDRDRAIDRPIDCRTDGLRPALARCIHWASEHTALEPGGDYRFWVRVCRRIAWNLHHPL